MEQIINVRLEGDGEEETKSKAAIEILSRKFKQFDIIPATDHEVNISQKSKSKSVVKFKQFAATDYEPINLSQEATLAILKEWKILKEGLPDSIYVRAYEGRIDLLTAVIIGQAGTPFQGGLFFYVFQFPSDYPNSVPEFSVYVNACKNVPWNPTLDPDHTICRHFPIKPACFGTKKRSILESLIWIQSNIIGSNPYFNMSEFIRPDYNPSTYNQDIFVFNCLTMLGLLDRPPKHFEEFVVQHFLDNSESILIACEAYIADAENNTGDHTVESSICTPGRERLERHNKIFVMYILRGMLVKEFRKIGSTSPMVKHPAGYWLFRVLFPVLTICFVVLIMLLIKFFGHWDYPASL